MVGSQHENSVSNVLHAGCRFTALQCRENGCPHWLCSVAQHYALHIHCIYMMFIKVCSAKTVHVKTENNLQTASGVHLSAYVSSTLEYLQTLISCSYFSQGLRKTNSCTFRDLLPRVKIKLITKQTYLTCEAKGAFAGVLWGR